jgi:chromosome segregation ATPase
MAKKKAASKPKAPRIANPRKQLESVRKEIRKVKQPLYALNRKIKNAPSKYYERKFKKERNAYLESIQPRITDLTSRRTELTQRSKKYEENKQERSRVSRKVGALEKKIRDAVDNKDIKQAEKLRYQLLKQLGILDDLHRQMGVPIPKADLSEFDRKDQEGGAGFEIDARSPYSIWEAIKQLDNDVNGGEFKYIIVNGKRFSTESVIQISAEASAFWITSKEKKQAGTPYINRFENDKTSTVKYLYYAS